jgi:hypothetical protein
MVEALITGVASLIIGVGSGVLTVNGRSNSRMDEIDKRIDGIELRFAEKYVPRQELAQRTSKDGRSHDQNREQTRPDCIEKWLTLRRLLKTCSISCIIL